METRDTSQESAQINIKELLDPNGMLQQILGDEDAMMELEILALIEEISTISDKIQKYLTHLLDQNALLLKTQIDIEHLFELSKMNAYQSWIVTSNLKKILEKQTTTKNLLSKIQSISMRFENVGKKFDEIDKTDEKRIEKMEQLISEKYSHLLKIFQ